MTSLTPFYLIPGLVCLFWMAAHTFLARKLRTYVLFCYLLGAIVVTSCGDVLIESVFSSDAIAHLVVQLLAPMIIPLACMYSYLMLRELKFGPLLQFWIIVPAALFTSCLILTLLKGVEGTDEFIQKIHSSSHPVELADMWERAYYLSTVVLFRTVMIIEGVLLIVYGAKVRKKLRYGLRYLGGFLFHGRKISVVALQLNLLLWIALILGLKVFLHPYFVHAPGWSIAIALVIAVLFFFFGFFGLFGAKMIISLEDIRTALRFNYSLQTRSEVTESIIMDMADDLSGESLTRVLSRLSTQSGTGGRKASGAAQTPSLSSAIFSNAPRSDDPGSLASRFQHLMQAKQLFLQPRLGLADVAEQLDTNKTYVSKMVNKTYGIGFPEVLNIMRVDYACEYIRRRPRASQEDIARACGFLSASSFNSTFKRITGYTPKVWAARMASSAGE